MVACASVHRLCRATACEVQAPWPRGAIVHMSISAEKRALSISIANMLYLYQARLIFWGLAGYHPR